MAEVFDSPLHFLPSYGTEGADFRHGGVSPPSDLKFQVWSVQVNNEGRQGSKCFSPIGPVCLDLENFSKKNFLIYGYYIYV